jgi:hypothetical protein
VELGEDGERRVNEHQSHWRATCLGARIEKALTRGRITLSCRISNFSTQPATMSQKRKHEEASAEDHDAPKHSKKPRPDAKAGASHSKTKGKRRPEQKTYTTTSQLKGRIRDLKRLLEHVDNTPKHKMSATMRIERERELATCEHQVAEKVAAAREVENRQKMITKYHQVRFFGQRTLSLYVKSHG